ncbi:GlyS [Desulforapulum autotrophicum HRM2]|uniref:Glycine--tRNA ligase beta subunit n=1 Tax=Desulforapulum autotrophicum (strain ATCC 43914 / DSM 3382 / VKM B-1955 / HRM2) TaxID=177437 RepID=SYGB_DESAH|nr:glycine--tRNA ligase subunit beta [Desulforapulum autotrophicum]C0QJ89.1 RecName: Full=Glycine--tRNA ligase beta subunit; AltName: Full=Glycyl-tRNA synthetase beta subunit; Short=GlyRS [Desulforapulum autotrophicum HRM2]ACN15902.1 GlyS [Desulforapulum autotrophicum HRM2]
MNNLLIEIGAEEIPAGYILPALTSFCDRVTAALTGARINHGKTAVFGTPRRLALMVEDVQACQAPQKTTLMGPPQRIGFDNEGKPTLAGVKFAEKAGIVPEEIIITDNGKGPYLSAVIEESCLLTEAILEGVLPELIQAIPFPKSMHWGDLDVTFARPIVSLTALLGKTVLNFKIGNIASASFVFGHSFMAPERFELESADAYLDTLRKAGVVADIGERRTILKESIKAAADKACATIIEDEELVDIVNNLVEYPYPVVGHFDEVFLELPDEVLITAMREHQKYFALADTAGKLMPCFIAVNNTRARDMDVVAKGHGKVIRARLADAQFFYHVDLESTLDDFVEKLKAVTFQASLGSMYEKTGRLVVLVEFLAGLVNADQELQKKLMRAARLSKADLVSQMVIEFTKLQGIIGRVYAQKGGEDPEVAMAIEEHYRPVYSGGDLPRTDTGKILAIADKTDTLCGCFSANLIPTGASDPYALRRQSIGILQIMLEAGFDFSLRALVRRGVAQYQTDPDKKNEISTQILEFLKGRMTNMLVDQGFSREAVNAALSVSFYNVPDAFLRIKALDILRQEPDFEPLSTAFKRVVNILKKAGGDAKTRVNVNLFNCDAEKALHQACGEVTERVDTCIKAGDYGAALKEISTLRPHVDRLFEDVMVMDDDVALRINRMALLSSVAALFRNIADFSQI